MNTPAYLLTSILQGFHTSLFFQKQVITRFFCLILVCLQLFCLTSYSQQPSAKFTHLTNLDGLSQSTVQAIVKDKYGFMWFGTQDGLNRYDGYTFKIYRHMAKDPHSLRKSNIISLYEDRSGNLWVGTVNGALSMYDRKHDSFIHYKESSGSNEGLSQKSATVIYEDKQKNFWIGTYWKLNLLDRKTGKIVQFGHDSSDTTTISDDAITCIFEDSRNNLWIGTSDGLNILDRKTKKFRHFFYNKESSKSLSSNHITAITEDNRGRLWVGTNNGLNLFDPLTSSFSRFLNIPGDKNSISNNVINTIADEGNGTLWIGTGNTLELFDVDKGMFIHYENNARDSRSLSRNAPVMSLLRDSTGILWVGSYQGGINRYDEYLPYFDLYKNNPDDIESLSFDIVTSFVENREGNIWVATGGGALNLWERSANRFIRYNPDPNNNNTLSSWGVLCLASSKKTDYLWIGTYGNGMDCYDPKTKTFKHYIKGDAPTQLNDDAVYALLEDQRGKIWIGTNGGGVNVLDPYTGIISKYKSEPNNDNSICGNYIRCFYEDRKGNIWIGSSSGLSVYDPVTNRFSKCEQINIQLESDAIYSVYQDSQGNLWIGTLGGGINLIDPQTNKVTAYTTSNGLPDNTINKILEDDQGYLWLSTNNGISRFDTGKKSFKNSSLYNGIQSPEFLQGSGLKTSSGEILFGGVNGFNHFDPGSLMENQNIPPVVITDFRLFNKVVKAGVKNSPLKESISLAKKLTLSYNQSMITFEFSALGYTASEKNQYAYMLEGFDQSWNYVGSQRQATYTNLDPGCYTFMVKAANNDGLWNEKPTIIDITILPPYWKTWWFRAAAIACILGTIFLIYRIRVKTINAQKIKLQHLVAAQTQQLLQSTEEEHIAREQAEEANKELERKNKELEQFAYIASHDMQEPLRTVSNFTELLQRKYKGRFDAKADSYFMYIQQSSERMRVLIKDLLDYSRIGRKAELERVNCEIILQQTLQDLDATIQETRAEIKSGPLPVISGSPTEIKQVFQNLIVNAIKFRKRNVQPSIKIEAKKKNKYWEFAFSDNGIGIDKKHAEKVFIIFQRLHNRNEYEGSGIGLANCKKIVELHGGKMWFESEPGEGTTFYFTIRDNKNVSV